MGRKEHIDSLVNWAAFGMTVALLLSIFASAGLVILILKVTGHL